MKTKKLKNVTPERPSTYFLSSDEGVDDEYFINEIIGIDEIRYDDWIKGPSGPKVANPTPIHHVKKDE